MGRDYLMINPETKTYLKLPKQGEWCNELWKIWEFIQLYGVISIFHDEDLQYNRILNNEEWSDFEITHLECMPYKDLICNADDIACGAHMAIFNAMNKIIQEDEKGYEKKK